jgi:hypothetical protein
MSMRRSAIGVRQTTRCRIRSMLQAGQMTTGCMPRSHRSRHSRSIGAWNPLMTEMPASGDVQGCRKV